MPGGGIARAARLADVSREKLEEGNKSPTTTGEGVAKVLDRCPEKATESDPRVQYRLPDRPPAMSGGSRRGDRIAISDLSLQRGWSWEIDRRYDAGQVPPVSVVSRSTKKISRQVGLAPNVFIQKSYPFRWSESADATDGSSAKTAMERDRRGMLDNRIGILRMRS